MVSLENRHADWAREYEREAGRLSGALGTRVTALEHIGSTAVPGLVAKPVIDLAARAAEHVDVFGLAELIAPLGYEMHRSGPKNHGVYVRADQGTRTHILHVFAHESWDACNQRLFRDKLVHDLDARERYGAAKVELATEADGAHYTEAKSAIVQELLDEERAARGLPSVRAWDK